MYANTAIANILNAKSIRLSLINLFIYLGFVSSNVRQHMCLGLLKYVNEC